MKNINAKSIFERTIAVLTWVSRRIEAEVAEEIARRDAILSEFKAAEQARISETVVEISAQKAKKVVVNSRKTVRMPTNVVATC